MNKKEIVEIAEAIGQRLQGLQPNQPASSMWVELQVCSLDLLALKGRCFALIEGEAQCQKSEQEADL